MMKHWSDRAPLSEKSRQANRTEFAFWTSLVVCGLLATLAYLVIA